MDYLRTLGSAAVSSLVQKSGLNLPFLLGIKVTIFEGACTLYDGTKRDDGSSVSIFEYEFSDPSKQDLKLLAKNALRKLRTTRHPDVLKFMDAVESDTSIYIMTERVRPLQATLQTWSSRDVREREDWLLWGLHRISVALAFVNDSCMSTHGNVRVNSIFISPSGEWKLGGFELLSNSKDELPVLYTIGGVLPGLSSWAPPEVKKSGWSVLKEADPAAADGYALGLLLHAVFNPTHPPPPTIEPPHPPPTSSSRGSIPTSVFHPFKKLLNPNPKARLSPKGFLDLGLAESGFFATNRLVKVCLGLDNFALGSEAEKNTLLRTLKESASSFPPEFASFKVLPSLVSALEFGGASAAIILPLVLQFGTNVSPEDYPNVIIAPLIKLYGSPDRGTRMALLEHLPEYADKLDQKAVSDKIYPQLQTGFADTVAVIREATVKSIILLSPKLSSKILNNDLLRHLAKMQMDPEASIRTNTCILIGRLGPSLGYNTKRKVLVPAFSRALKDTFVHARVAGLMAFMATIECFEVDELATKVIPNMSFALIDKERLVRDQAFKAIDLFVKKLESHAATMPESALTEGDSTDISGNGMPGAMPTQTMLVNSAAGAAGALAGWAISSLGKTLAKSDMQSSMSLVPGSNIEQPTGGESSIESRIGNLRPSPLSAERMTMSATVSPVSTPAFAAHRSTLGKSKGMQLSSNRIPPVLAAAALADKLAEEASAADNNDSNPWGNDDLIDVNADEDDWSAFESAPTVADAKPVQAVGLALEALGAAGSSSQRRVASETSNGVKTTPATDSWVHNSHPSRAATSNKGSTSLRSTPVSSSPPADTGAWDSDMAWDKPTVASTSPSVTSTAGMSKEGKAAEMARRKEERKQRIALLKEQKKSTSKP